MAKISRTSNGVAKIEWSEGNSQYLANLSNVIVRKGSKTSNSPDPLTRADAIKLVVDGQSITIGMDDLEIGGVAFSGSVEDALQLISNNILPAPSEGFAVQKLAQTITFEGVETATEGDAPITLEATSTSGLPVSFASSDTGVATVAGNVLTIVGDGTTDITASQAGDANYNAATPVVVELTVEPEA